MPRLDQSVHQWDQRVGLGGEIIEQYVCIQRGAKSSEIPDLGVFVMETYYSKRESKNPGLFSKGKLAKSSPRSPCQKPPTPDTGTK